MKRTARAVAFYLLLVVGPLSAQSTPAARPGSEVERCSPCRCPEEPPSCPRGVAVVTDGCGCCSICGRQQGEACDRVQLCDSGRRLRCHYRRPRDPTGICQVKQGRSCLVAGRVYPDGETFKLDCRTQCTCQNGTYGCVSLCPHENIRPSGNCRNPQLVPLRSACCREWLCETSVWEHKEPDCERYSSEWSPCSVSCGAGWSSRVTNHNAECRMRKESRVCQIRPCQETTGPPAVGHHTRRNHLCRATVKSSSPVRIVDDRNCSSVKLYEPKFCGRCRGRRCCRPRLTTTVEMTFDCSSSDREEGSPLRLARDYMWIVKCVCDDRC
ncbi:CCN family member 2-like isoform X1 [Centruroides vittatus]|uniref:CCN family member 2-like isoform X1 n=1 Tax=Centruroides vittatus TaxID=120091 RepID=UPI00350FA0FF